VYSGVAVLFDSKAECDTQENHEKERKKEKEGGECIPSKQMCKSKLAPIILGARGQAVRGKLETCGRVKTLWQGVRGGGEKKGRGG